MKKYNLSEIMKNAWELYRIAQKWVNKLSFGECLHRAWTRAKETVKAMSEAAKTGLRRMHYSEYKASYIDCETVPGSYDKRTKTIEVKTLVRKIRNSTFASRLNSLCPYCHTYCYGDCRAH